MNTATPSAGALSDETIIEIRRATRCPDPAKAWSDTLAFARAVLAAEAELAKHVAEPIATPAPGVQVHRGHPGCIACKEYSHWVDRHAGQRAPRHEILLHRAHGIADHESFVAPSPELPAGTPTPRTTPAATTRAAHVGALCAAYERGVDAGLGAPPPDTPHPADSDLAEAYALGQVTGHALGDDGEAIEELFQAIAHGDEAHRAWLRSALVAVFAGKPMPPPAALPSADPPGTVRVPLEPPYGLLVSMALRHNHGFGLLEEAARQILIDDMRKVHEEVVGRGFYVKERDPMYTFMGKHPPTVADLLTISRPQRSHAHE